jgi:prepilin-type N-terminal cleavage/methylation domain-containing protein
VLTLKNNSKGMTVVELLVAIAIFSVVTAITYSVYISNTKIVSKTDTKAMLQSEAQYIQQTITKIGMQSSGIESIIATPITNDSEFRGYYEVARMDVKSIDENNDNVIYRFKIDNKNSKDKDIKTLKIEKLDQTNKTVISENVLSENIRTFKIKPIPNIEDINKIKGSKSIEVYIGLNKKKGFSDVDYNISTLITFRNK